MKRAKIRRYSLNAVILSGVISMLGFGSCAKSNKSNDNDTATVPVKEENIDKPQPVKEENNDTAAVPVKEENIDKPRPVKEENIDKRQPVKEEKIDKPRPVMYGAPPREYKEPPKIHDMGRERQKEAK